MSRLFGQIVALRSRLYQGGFLTTRRLSHPVVSIGNLTTGGTGKTPLVITLAGALLRQGYRPVVLSRGYRRRSRGVQVVSRGHGPEVDWAAAGDEPFLMARRLPGVSVVVGNDRLAAGLRAETEDLGNLFILDDGFQHLKLFRNIDIVAIDPNDWNGEERLLPYGTWREPRSAISRAHAACVRQDAYAAPLELPVPQFGFTTRVDGIFRRGRLVDIKSLGSQPLTAFAGIARSERFFATLNSMGLNVASATSFPDHHDYRATDLTSLPKGLRITTEKDAVKLEGHDLYCVRVSADIANVESLVDLMLERIRSEASSPHR